MDDVADIVKRLRALAKNKGDVKALYWVGQEAADRVEALAARLSAAEGAADFWHQSSDQNAERCAALGAENKRMREALVRVDSLAERGRVWGGTKGWVYQGLNEVVQKKILETIRAALNDESESVE